MPKWFDIFKNKADPECTNVMLYDDIGGYGVSAKEFCRELNSIKTKKINVHINSGGGEVFDAFAIYSAIKAHDSEVTCCVDGLAASAASVIAMSGDKVRMARNSFMMMHNVSTMCFGDAGDLRKSADLVDKLSESVAKAYSDKSGKSVDDVRSAMNEETWFDADEAKKWGLVDEVSDDDGDENGMALAAKFCINKYQKAPPALRKFAAKLADKPPTQNKESKMEKLELRDGKYFIGTQEVEVAGALVPPTNEAAISKAASDAVEKERAYRLMFNNIMDTAKITGDAAKEFEKEFYSRDEKDLKFLASHAIGTRAKPVGEGNPGNPGGEGGDDKSKEQADIKTYCESRFAKDANIRRLFHVNTINPADPNYQAGLAKFIAVETKSRTDWQNKAVEDQDEPQREDRISQLMKNKSVYSA